MGRARTSACTGGGEGGESYTGTCKGPRWSHRNMARRVGGSAVLVFLDFTCVEFLRLFVLLTIILLLEQ